MTYEEFVDVHIDDFRDKLPHVLRQNPRTAGFLMAFSEKAEPIIEAAAMLGETEAAYAKQRLAEVLLAFSRETGLRSD